MTDRIIGEVTGATGYRGLISVLRSWVCELDTSYESIDELAGWEGRYVSKLLAPSAIKGLGRTSMGAILGALGLKLHVVVDEPALEKIRRRLVQSRWPKKRREATAMRRALTRQTPVNPSRTQFKGNRAWALDMHAKAMAATTPEFRRARASLAAKAANEKRRRLREAAAEARV
jgi:hypothetical protein